MLPEYETARHAVCCLLMNREGRILAITRLKKDGEADLDRWGMPGGKVESHESLDVAVVRETFEETGFVIAAPQSVYTAFVPGESNFICTTFVAHIVAKTPDAPRSIPYEGDVAWVEPHVLATGPYAQYNQACSSTSTSRGGAVSRDDEIARTHGMLDGLSVGSTGDRRSRPLRVPAHARALEGVVGRITRARVPGLPARAR